MNRRLLVVATLSFVFPLAAIAQSTEQTASVTTPTSQREIHDLIKSAHTTAQYKELAGYYCQQEAEYRAKAAAERVERDRRAQVDAVRYQKYPRPVDSAQYLYESYVSSADSAALQAQHYDQLASGQTRNGDQLAVTP